MAEIYDFEAEKAERQEYFYMQFEDSEVDMDTLNAACDYFDEIMALYHEAVRQRMNLLEQRIAHLESKTTVQSRKIAHLEEKTSGSI